MRVGSGGGAAAGGRSSELHRIQQTINGHSHGGAKIIAPITCTQAVAAIDPDVAALLQVVYSSRLEIHLGSLAETHSLAHSLADSLDSHRCFSQ